MEIDLDTNDLEWVTMSYCWFFSCSIGIFSFSHSELEYNKEWKLLTRQGNDGSIVTLREEKKITQVLSSRIPGYYHLVVFHVTKVFFDSSQFLFSELGTKSFLVSFRIFFFKVKANIKIVSSLSDRDEFLSMDKPFFLPPRSWLELSVYFTIRTH